jgi:hypothetical protein
VLSSSHSDGSIIYINSPSPPVTCVFIRRQVRSRHRPTASTTWISHLVGAGSIVRFGGMTHDDSPSLHIILEESPSEDDSALSEGESYGSPFLRTCSMVIPVRARTLHHRWRQPQCPRQQQQGHNKLLHQQPSLSNGRLIRRDNNVPCGMTSSERLCSIKAHPPPLTSYQGTHRAEAWHLGKQRWRPSSTDDSPDSRMLCG